MELYLDTADLNAVETLAEILPLSGVTTNPSIVAAEKMPLFQCLNALRQILGKEKLLFAQTLSAEKNAIIAEAHQLYEQVENIVVKIPVSEEGLKAIQVLKQDGIPTLGTAVYGAGQGFLGALAGATYIAPYVNRVDSQGGDGVGVVRDLQHLFQIHQLPSKVLAASFRTPKQVLDCCLAGCQAITVSPALISAFWQDPAVFAAVEKFEQDWQKVFNRLSF